MKWLCGVLLLSLLVGCSRSGEFKASVLDLGLGFTAKNYCSCVFVAEHSEDFCQDYASIEQVKPKLTIDFENKISESRLFFVFSAKAVYNGAQSGCALL